MATEETQAYMNTEEAAAYLRRTRKSLEMWRCNGTGPAYIPGRPVLYKKSDLDAFMESRRVVPALNRPAA